MQHYSTIHISLFFAPTSKTHLLTHNNNDPFKNILFISWKRRRRLPRRWTLVGEEEE